MKANAERGLLFILSTVLVICLHACAGLGGVVPKTFEDKVGAAQITVTQVRSAALNLSRMGIISVADLQNTQDSANKARDGIDIARAMRSSDPVGAENKLQMTLAVLQAATTYICSLKKDEPLCQEPRRP
jgi:hypothetical protein